MRREADEEALMAAYVAGDARAFERLFRVLAPSIRAFFSHSVGPGAVADDLAQTTFLKMHAGRATFRGGERLRPWVFTIAARVRADWLRSLGRPVAELDEGAPDPDPRHDPGREVLASERAERVREAVGQLPEAQRVVVHLHRYEELSFAEIGRVLGISEGAARIRAFRAYDRLRTLLGDLVAEGRS
jgi:RNA polymerase sigma-70 factor (ECF subfamily)